MPPPFVSDGFWADYADLESTFPEEWSEFVPRERRFFSKVWAERTHSIGRVYWWFVRQQLRLLHPRVFLAKKLRWFLYLPLQVIVPLVLLFASVRFPSVVTGFLADVRLYLDPMGIVERTIVQRIDYRVGGRFLQMLGLDWDFLPLPEAERLRVGPKTVVFDRVVWVCHSLGTVISFNVLSDLLHRAAETEQTKLSPALSEDLRQRITSQKEGIVKFRGAVRRFITMGSPLEKAAFLFPTSIRDWPTQPGRPDTAPLRWVNFYHVLDPVSGRLQSDRLCGQSPPSNLHIRSGLIPGAAHVRYWKDKWRLRYVLSRTYGKEVLFDQEYEPLPLAVRGLVGFGAYCVWAVLLGGMAYYAIAKLWPWLLAAGALVVDVLKL